MRPLHFLDRKKGLPVSLQTSPIFLSVPFSSIFGQTGKQKATSPKTGRSYPENKYHIMIKKKAPIFRKVYYFAKWDFSLYLTQLYSNRHLL